MGEAVKIAEDVHSGDLAGRRVGPYRLVTEVARGGMATVYLAVDTSSPSARLAAVKVIHAELANDEALLRMFFDEARISSQISHPSTARVLDFGSDGQTHYLVMDYLLGETWQQVLCEAVTHQDTGTRMRLPVLLAHVLQRAALGLHAAHESRDSEDNPLHVVHRDVSPQNIMVGYDGQVHVLDFGIAKASNRFQDTEHGTVKGRFAYMAPEQMRGRAVDRRADLWPLGVMLWEGLTCRRLFRRDSDPETIMATAYAPIPSPKEINPAAPPALCEIARSLLQRNRDQRPESAKAVADSLEAYLIDEGGSLHQTRIQREMSQLFGARAEAKRRTLARLRRRYSRPIQVDMLLPDDMPTRPLPAKPPRPSGIRARSKKTVPDRVEPSLSEFPTLPRLTLPQATERIAQIRSEWLWWIAMFAATLGASAYLWISG